MAWNTYRVPAHIAHPEARGPAGVEWVARLPEILERCERDWALRIGAPFPDLTYNYVAPVRCADGSEAVLKACPPGAETVAEMEVLRLVDGQGMVRLLRDDADEGLMLLERLNPGTQLVEVEDDEEATRIAAGIMRDIWRPVPPETSLPSTADWFVGLAELRAHFNGGTGPFPLDLVERAEMLAGDLLAGAATSVVLHGDLHHFNVVRAQRAPWLAIDPQGVIGEPAYEPGAWLRNPFCAVLRYPDPLSTMTRRIAIFAGELDLDARRIRDWAIAQAVLSAWWDYEDGGPETWWDVLEVGRLLNTVRV